jgi:hypothetical protein
MKCVAAESEIREAQTEERREEDYLCDGANCTLGRQEGSIQCLNHL